MKDQSIEEHRASECDIAAREATIEELIFMLLLRHESFITFRGDHSYKDVIKQARDSARKELKWRIDCLEKRQVIHRDTAGDINNVLKP